LLESLRSGLHEPVHRPSKWQVRRVELSGSADVD
jgi:hypothetical protein